jgi:hypothetical protein
MAAKVKEAVAARRSADVEKLLLAVERATVEK